MAWHVVSHQLVVEDGGFDEIVGDQLSCVNCGIPHHIGTSA